MSAVPNMRNWIPGELGTAAMLNSQMRDPAKFFVTPPMCQLTNTSAESIPNNAWTLVTWNTEIVDTENHHSVLSNTGRINVIWSGLYDLRGVAYFAANQTGARAAKIERVNPGGTRTVVTETGGFASNASPENGLGNPETTVQLGDPGFYLDAGDYLEMSVIQSSGGSLNLLMNGTSDSHSWFALRWVAAS